MDYAHQPDIFYWLLGEDASSGLCAGCQGGDLPLQSNPNLMAVTLEYDEPLIATIHLNYVQHPDRGSCEIIGDQGWALFETGSNSLAWGFAAPGRKPCRSSPLSGTP